MGLYPIDCPECGLPYMWFSGSMDQRCDACKYGEPVPQYYYIEMAKGPDAHVSGSAVVYTERVDGLNEDAIHTVDRASYDGAIKRLEGVRKVLRKSRGLV